MNLSLNLNQMLFANLHVGHSVNFFNSRLKGILIGVRKKTCILNLNISILQFQILSNLVLNLISRRHPILLVKEWNYLKFNDYISKQLLGSMKNLVIYEEKWFGGTLSNYKSVFFCSKFENKNLLNLQQKKRFPSLLCFFNSNLSNWALLEGYNLKIPTASLIDIDSQFFSLVNYPIISNNKNINSSLLYISVICNSVKYGRKKEVTRILKFSEFLYNQPKTKRLMRTIKNKKAGKYNSLLESYKIWLFRRYVLQGWNTWEVNIKI